jgi:hypothetical protein
MNKEFVQAMYNYVRKNGYTKDYDTFIGQLQSNDELRKTLYREIQKEDYKHDYDTYLSQLGISPIVDTLPSNLNQNFDIGVTLPNVDDNAKLRKAEDTRQNLLRKLSSQYKGDFNKLIDAIDNGKALPEGVSPNTRDFYNTVKSVYNLPTNTTADLPAFDSTLQTIQNDTRNAYNPIVNQTLALEWRGEDPNKLDYLFPSGRMRSANDEDIMSTGLGYAQDIFSIPSRGAFALASGQSEAMAIPSEMGTGGQQMIDYTLGGMGMGTALKGVGGIASRGLQSPVGKSLISKIPATNKWMDKKKLEKIQEASNIIKNPNFVPQKKNPLIEGALETLPYEALPFLHTATTSSDINPNAATDALIGAGAGVGLGAVGKGIGSKVLPEPTGASLERYGRGPIDRLLPYEQYFPSYDDVMTPQEVVKQYDLAGKAGLKNIDGANRQWAINQIQDTYWKNSAGSAKTKIDDMLAQGLTTPEETTVLRKMSKLLDKVDNYEQFQTIMKDIGARSENNSVYKKAYGLMKKSLDDVSKTTPSFDDNMAKNYLDVTKDIGSKLQYPKRLPGAKKVDGVYQVDPYQVDPYQLDTDLAKIGRNRLDITRKASTQSDIDAENTMKSLKLVDQEDQLSLENIFGNIDRNWNISQPDIYKRINQLGKERISLAGKTDEASIKRVKEITDEMSNLNTQMISDYKQKYKPRFDKTIEFVEATDSPYLTMAVIDQIRKRIKGDDMAISTFDRLLDFAVQNGIMKRGSGIAKDALLSLLENSAKIGVPKFGTTEFIDSDEKKRLRETFKTKEPLPPLDWGI